MFIHDLDETDNLQAQSELSKGAWICAAKEAFAQYINDVNLDSRQIYFANQIVEHIVHNGMLKNLSVPQKPPFTDQGNIVEVFTELTFWADIKGVIERINANAAAILAGKKIFQNQLTTGGGSGKISM